MKSQPRAKVAGFTLVELMIAMAVTLVLLYSAVALFRDAAQSSQVVAQASDLSDNLRTGLNMIQLDLQQVGTGIPTGGINIPFTAPCGTTPPINRPSLGGGTTFPYTGAPTCESVIPAVEPGYEMGPPITAPDAVAGTPANPDSITDELTMLYADNTIGLNNSPVNQPATPGPPASAGCPNGNLQLNGNTLSVTFDSTCVNISNSSNGNMITINPGDLIMFSNSLGTALLCVTSISGQTLTFAPGDAFDLNGRTETGGTINQIETGGAFPTTLATRIWMITYYLDNVTAPPYTRLIRRVNFNTPAPLGETLENLQFTYNFVDGVTNPANQPTVPTGNSESNIRAVNVYLGARSTYPVRQGGQSFYARSNLMTQVSLRSLAYVNRYE